MKWEQIETAPKDGTKILLVVRNMIVEAYWGVNDGDYNNPAWCAVYGMLNVWGVDAKHWAHKPKTPID